MSEPTTAKDREATFRGFTAAQAAHYSSVRGAYPGGLYEFLMERHLSTGGQTNLVVDIGCGPGNSTRDLAPLFTHAIGVDHGDGMLKTAIELGGTTESGEAIKYANATAETFDGLQEIKELGKADLVTAATAVHWFDMPKFWEAAAKVVKPGGTVAFWTYGRGWLHPSTPNLEKAHEALQRNQHDDPLTPYMLPGNLLVRDHLQGLVLPWSPECSSTVRDAFGSDEKDGQYVRQEWNAGGKPGPDGDFFGGSRRVTLAQLEKISASGSPIVRWREAHPDLVGTDKDIVKVQTERVRVALGLTKEEVNTKELIGGASIIMMIFKRK